MSDRELTPEEIKRLLDLIGGAGPPMPGAAVPPAAPPPGWQITPPPPPARPPIGPEGIAPGMTMAEGPSLPVPLPPRAPPQTVEPTPIMGGVTDALLSAEKSIRPPGMISGLQEAGKGFGVGLEKIGDVVGRAAAPLMKDEAVGALYRHQAEGGSLFDVKKEMPPPEGTTQTVELTPKQRVEAENSESYDEAIDQGLKRIEASEKAGVEETFKPSAGKKIRAEPKSEKAKAEDRLRELEAMRNMAMGLGRLGEMTSASEILLGMKPRKFGERGELGAIDAEIDLLRGLRGRDLAETTGGIRPGMHDPTSSMSQHARHLARQLGHDIPDDMTFSEVTALYPRLATLVTQREFQFLSVNSDYKKAMITAFAKMEEGEKLKPAELNAVVDINSAIDQMANALKLKQQYQFDTGPLVNAWEKMLNLVGFETKRLGVKNGLRASLIAASAAYRKAISGANVSKYEIRLLDQVLPGVGDNDLRFEAKAKTFMSMLRRRRAIMLNAYEKGGYDVSPLRATEDEIVSGRDFFVIDFHDPPPGADPHAALARAREKGYKEHQDYVVIDQNGTMRVE